MKIRVIQGTSKFEKFVIEYKTFLFWKKFQVARQSSENEYSPYMTSLAFDSFQSAIEFCNSLTKEKIVQHNKEQSEKFKSYYSEYLEIQDKKEKEKKSEVKMSYEIDMK